jgi:DNA end-binding protein Ku
MAQQLISSLSTDFDPGRYQDNYRERVLNLIERKAAGEEIAVQPEAEEPDAAPDLMAALEASLAAVRSDDPEPDKPAKAEPKAKAKPKARKAPASDGDGAKAKKPRAKARS